MWRLLVVLAILIYMPNVVFAYSFNVDGANVDIGNGTVSVSGENGTVTVDENGWTAEGVEGQVSVDESGMTATDNASGISIKTDDVKLDDKGNVIVDENVYLDETWDDDFDSMVWDDAQMYFSEEEGTSTNGLKFKSFGEDSIVLTDGSQDITISIGMEGVKVSDKSGSVVVYYGQSGIQTSDIKIGDKTGNLYLITDFGEVRVGVIPNGIYQDLKDDNEIQRVEFAWSTDGSKLFYKYELVKNKKFLGMMTVKIRSIEYYNIENGEKTKTDKSAWHSFLDKVSWQ